MGVAKREMEDHEAKFGAALDIAIQAGVLEQCEFHDGCIFELSGDLDAAYKLGNSRFTAGKLNGTFASRREMTDLIKEAVESNSADECPSCAKVRDED
jgi:hypothetical protein